MEDDKNSVESRSAEQTLAGGSVIRQTTWTLQHKH